MTRSSSAVKAFVVFTGWILGIHCVSEITVLAQSPGADALVAAYGFGEGSGTTAADLSGNLLTGTLTGATWTTNGRYGGAVSFDGSGDWVTVNSSPLLNLSTGMTVQAWVYPTAISSWRTVIMKETSGGLSYALYANDAGNRPSTFVNFGGADLWTNGTAQLPLNTWTHLAATYNGSTLRLYVNGTNVRSRNLTGSLVSSSSALRIGGNSPWGEYFSGRIDEVRVHNRALTQTEIQSLMSIPVEEAQGFRIIVYNSPAKIGLSDYGIYNLGVDPIGGFTGPVSPSVSGLPAATTAVFEPWDGPPHPGPFALTIYTSSNTPPGNYSVTLTCTNGALSASTNLPLTVTSDPGFRIAVEPTSLTVAHGQNGIAAFEVTSENGYSQNVTLQATGVPSGTTASFSPSTVVPTGSGLLQFGVSPTTPPGTYPVALKATDGVLTQQVTFTLTVQVPTGGGSWNQVSLGDANAMYYGVVVGNVTGINSNRVFGSAGDGLMYEYIHSGGSWSFLQMPVGAFADGEMHNMDVGPGRGDGTNRLYIAAVYTGRVYEMSWVNGAWHSNLVAAPTGSTDIIIGNGRNDGVTRMYVTWMAGLAEYTWNGSGWNQVMISTNESGWVHGVDMGAGRNDGTNRIYTANQGNGEVYEYTWNGSSWSKVFMGDLVDSRNIEVGQGRNDGLNRVYVASGGGNVYEFTRTNSTWQVISMGNAGNADVKVQCIPAKARSDNLTRIYVAAGSGVFEYQWTGSAWTGARLGDAVAYMYGLAVGDGRNNGKLQVYGSAYDGNVYMFEWQGVTTTVTVPNVVGLTQQAATTAITNAGLTLGVVTTGSSQTVPAGSVISQNPVAGTQIAPASAVNLLVSTGLPTVTVPNVVGQTQNAATNAIIATNLTVGTISNQFSQTVPAGSVISQNPLAGTQVAAGSAVSLVVSLGPQMVTVPNVVGQTQTAATSAIVATNLTVGTTSNQFSQTVPAGSVVSQDPLAGTQVAMGSAVNLVVSLGPQMVTVPNVVGQTQTAATNVIIATNLTVGTISNQFSQTVPAGSVISQNPLAGTQVAAGSAVSLLVSLGPQMITVPDVVGQTQNAATNAIIATNLVVGTVSNQFNAIVPPGLVMGQEPAGGLEVSAGSTVNLVVSSGPLLLQLTQSADQLVLSWPTAAVGFNLVFNTDLVSTNWTLVSPSPVIEGENLVVTNQLADPVGFYRLQQ